MITQINPPLPLEVLNKGKGYAHFLIDYSQEHDLYWVVFMDESRECWTVSNKEVRIQENVTLGRRSSIIGRECA
jgi:hypothetical protein